MNKIVGSLKWPLIYLSVFGIIPWYSFREQKLVCSKIFISYSIVLAIVITVLTFGCTYMRFAYFYPALVTVLMIEDVIQEITGLCLFLIATLNTSLRNTSNWEMLYRKLKEIDSDIILHRVKQESCTVMKNLLLIFGLGNTYLITLFVLDFMQYRKSKVYLFVPTLIFRYTGFILAYIILSFGVMIKCRQERVKYVLRPEILISTRDLVKIFNYSKEVYLKMCDIIQIFNTLFGWPILLLYSYSVVQTLNCLSFLFRKPVHQEERIHTFLWQICVHLFYALGTMVWLTAIIFCCDSVVREADELLTNCYRLEQTLPLLSKELEELESLKKLIKNKRPKLTAAGFFEIRRSTLLSLLSTTTTYFIVALQFNSMH